MYDIICTRARYRSTVVIIVYVRIGIRTERIKEVLPSSLLLLLLVVFYARIL